MDWRDWLGATVDDDEDELEEGQIDEDMEVEDGSEEAAPPP